MVSRGDRDKERVFLQSIQLATNNAGYYVVTLGDAYDSKAGKAFVVDKQVIAFEKNAADQNNKNLIVFEPDGKNMSVAFAFSLAFPDKKLLCVKSTVTLSRPEASK